MCLTISTNSHLRYRDFIIAFKLFKYNKNIGLLPAIMTSEKYNIYYEEFIGYAIESYNNQQSISAVSEYWDIETNEIKTHKFDFYPFLLGMHSLLIPEILQYESYYSNLYRIGLLVLVYFRDIQMASENNIVSRKIILPKLELLQNIVSLIKKVSPSFLKDIGFNIKRLDIYSDPDYQKYLNMVYDKLSKITDKKYGVLE